MSYVLVQREAIGRPELPVPSRYERVWLCSWPGCEWWGAKGAQPHHDTNGGGKHRAESAFETSCDIRTHVYARYVDVPARYPRYPRRY